MRRKIILLLATILICFGLTGCVNGDMEVAETPAKYIMLLSDGSCFVYTFEDGETGVWYIATSKGVTPRLNADGTLYVSE